MAKKHRVPKLGALEGDTLKYVWPSIANKGGKYVCPDCKRPLIVKGGPGMKVVRHFAHYKSITPCDYYDRPSEAQIHKDAKLRLKQSLESGVLFTLQRNCLGFKGTCKSPDKTKLFDIPVVSETCKIIDEYGFQYNGYKRADIAYLNNGNLSFIFEICNTHATAETDRPEPWFEINAENFINTINDSVNKNQFNITCIRKWLCRNCQTAFDKNEAANAAAALKEAAELAAKAVAEEKAKAIEAANRKERARLQEEWVAHYEATKKKRKEHELIYLEKMAAEAELKARADLNVETNIHKLNSVAHKIPTIYTCMPGIYPDDHDPCLCCHETFYLPYSFNNSLKRLCIDCSNSRVDEICIKYNKI